MRLFRMLAGLLTASAVLEWAPPALACSEPCEEPVRLPPEPVLPGDMVYFELQSTNPGPLSLRTVDGEPVAASIRDIGGDRIFAADAAVAEGTRLVLEYTSACLRAPVAYEFITTSQGPIELSLGALVIEEQGLRFPGQPGEESFVRLRYYEPAASGTAHSLMRHQFRVDGYPLQLASFQGVDLIHVPTVCSPATEAVQIDTCGYVRALPAGSHVVVATTHIIGQEVQPEPVSLRLEVSCSGDVPLANGERASADGDATSIDSELVPESAGCSFAPRASNAAGALLSAFALASAVARRRRTAQRAAA